MISVMSRQQAVRYCYGNHAEKTAMISICDPDSAEARPFVSTANGVCAILPLSFFDVDQGDGRMTRKDAERVRDFVARHRDVPLIIHCGAGVSRSAGVAAAVSKYLTGNDREFFGSLYRPNMWCYRITLETLYGGKESDIV